MKQIEAAFKDDRGFIKDILTRTNIDAVTLISFEPGAVRGNHYHKDTTQWNFLLSGELEYYFSDEINSDSPESLILREGCLNCSEPGIPHAFRAIKKSILLVMTRGPRSGSDYEEDTFRLELPLVDEIK